MATMTPTNETVAPTTLNVPDLGPNGLLVKNIYDAFASGDVETVLGNLSPDCVWIECAGFPFAGTYEGPQAIAQGVFNRIPETLGANFECNVNDIVEGGNRVSARCNYIGTLPNGNNYNVRVAHTWTINDGVVIGFEQICDTAPLHQALGL